MTFEERYSKIVDESCKRYPSLEEIEKNINNLEGSKNDEDRQKLRKFKLLKILKERAYAEFEEAYKIKQRNKNK